MEEDQTQENIHEEEEEQETENISVTATEEEYEDGADYEEMSLTNTSPELSEFDKAVGQGQFRPDDTELSQGHEEGEGEEEAIESKGSQEEEAQIESNWKEPASAPLEMPSSPERTEEEQRGSEEVRIGPSDDGDTGDNHQRHVDGEDDQPITGFSEEGDSRTARGSEANGETEQIEQHEVEETTTNATAVEFN